MEIKVDYKLERRILLMMHTPTVSNLFQEDFCVCSAKQYWVIS
jgi:hypothetical protein